MVVDPLRTYLNLKYQEKKIDDTVKEEKKLIGPLRKKRRTKAGRAAAAAQDRIFGRWTKQIDQSCKQLLWSEPFFCYSGICRVANCRNEWEKERQFSER